LTIGIASRLNPRLDKKMRMDLVYSVFDDQLKAVTSMNRRQRHDARKMGKKAMKNHDIS